MGGGREYLRCDLEEQGAHARDALEEEALAGGVRLGLGVGVLRLPRLLGHHRLLGHRHLLAVRLPVEVLQQGLLGQRLLLIDGAHQGIAAGKRAGTAQRCARSGRPARDRCSGGFWHHPYSHTSPLVWELSFKQRLARRVELVGRQFGQLVLERAGFRRHHTCAAEERERSAASRSVARGAKEGAGEGCAARPA